MTCSDEACLTCNQGRDCPNRMMTNTHRVVVPFNTGRVQIGRAYTPRVTPQQAQWCEYQAAPSMLTKPGFWLGGVASLMVWWLIYALVTA